MGKNVLSIIQFCVWSLGGIIIACVLYFTMNGLHLDDVLHLGVFSGTDHQLANYSTLMIRDEVPFTLTYDISSNNTPFQVLLFNHHEYKRWKRGHEFTVVRAGSTPKTSVARINSIYVDNYEQDTYVLVIQRCIIDGRDYCTMTRLPSPLLSGGRKLYDTRPLEKPSMIVKAFTVVPEPQACANTPPRGYWYLLIFVPWIFVMGETFKHLLCSDSLSAGLQEEYNKELNVPESEVDYWQPIPWDRKIPKTRLFGPCCWKKIRRPTESFMTWWRHENYFTWIFYPYKNERLSRKERAIIIYCSLHVTFNVLFVCTLSLEYFYVETTELVVLGYIAISILPSIIKAIFKELFKLVYRMRRKHFRRRQENDTVDSLPVEKYLVAEFALMLLISAIHVPLLLRWLSRSCAFLDHFLWYWLLTVLTKFSVVGIVEDLVWYSFIYLVGQKDLCPYCTEQLKTCSCFNDNLLMSLVENHGENWDLIHKMAREAGEFELYTIAQLQDRYDLIEASQSTIDIDADLHQPLLPRHDKPTNTPRENHAAKLMNWLDTFDT